MLTERDIVAARAARHRDAASGSGCGKAGSGPPPRTSQGFSEADMARAALIRDLEDKLGFDEEQVPVLLNLIDQIHGLRAELKTMLDALEDLARRGARHGEDAHHQAQAEVRADDALPSCGGRPLSPSLVS